MLVQCSTYFRILLIVVLIAGGVLACSDDDAGSSGTTNTISFTVTDTGQTSFYNANGSVISAPSEGEAFYGQDAQYSGTQPSYRDNGDGTITDLNTGLVWQQTPDFTQYSFDSAKTYAENLTLAGYSDWRLPTIKELFSIADFRGEIVGGSASSSTPYIDTTYFYWEYVGDPYIGQFWSSTLYTTGGLQDTVVEGAFGFNFGDGHIKGYETGYYFNGSSGVMAPGNFVRCVRGAENVYGVNSFVDNGDNTVTDNATGLMWMAADDGAVRNWRQALSYAESSTHAGYSDWRLPNIKELQSIVEYGKSTWPAIDTAFFTLSGADSTNDAIWLWSSTTHGDNKDYASYICFGRAWGKQDSSATVFYDWHGAGAQRSDPKSGNPNDYYSASVNAVDLVQISNYCLLVRDSQ